MTALTPEEIRQALAENARTPYGAARNARAETLAAAAESSGDRELFRQALDRLIDAYEWSAERTKMVVPFARLLQEYDRDPAAFPVYEVHGLFWRFKWVAGRIVESPDIPLAAVEGWLVDMERRYRLAGYSERAVRQAEFHLADATGDEARMDRAAAGWTAAARDRMSDCHACEINTQGWYWARKGEDAKAIEIWAPVLSGEMSCMEEPHRVLAHSLLPLVRLGRLDEARSHHVRGYRMTRGNDSLLRSVGKHIEFCALTGNEPRGLEILAEYTTHLGPLTDVETQMEFAGGVLVLLRRLTDLGHGDRPAVPYRGTGHTVKELYERLFADATTIAARFDARNGSAHVSQRLAERIAQQPLVDVLPLGVRTAGLPAAPAPAGVRPAAAPAQAAAATDTLDLATLVEHARTVRRQGRPSADALWARVAERVAAGEALPDAATAADLLEFRATAAARAGSEQARELFARAADAQRAAGRPARAAYALLGVAAAAARSGAETVEIRNLLAVATEAARTLAETDPARARRVAAAELATLHIESYLRERETPEEDRRTRDAHLVVGLEEFVAAHGTGGCADADGDVDVADVVAEAELVLARMALMTGDLGRAEPLLASAAQRCLAAEHPWEAVEPLSLRARVLAARGDAEGAEALARAALAHAAELTDPEEHAAVRLTLAEILLRGPGAADEAAAHALEAVHWLDQAGLAATGGARARLLLARAYAEAERTAEAAEVLQSALPDLVEHGEQEAVEARRMLGELLRGLNDQRAAAEQYLLAAETAKGWENPRPQASLAHSAAEALAAAGLREEARSAYGRALELWRQAGDNPVGEVRVLRSLAWLAAEGAAGDDRYGQARALMEQALAVLEGSEEPESRYERAQTWQQLAAVLEDSLEQDAQDEEYEDEDDHDDGQDGGGTSANAEPDVTAEASAAVRTEIVALLDRASTGYAGLGEDALREWFQCAARAAWTEQEMGRAHDGTARLTALIARLGQLEGPEAAELAAQAEQIRERLG
ncbi:MULTISPECIES: tetratricopeptide repeat protein [unclassified Streptomyces]|uniref:tetratricopeptide repeat protein n=1 Tax=unclassified Streptomyces TaxID=2593676 RepID=UPI0033F6F299